MIMVYMEIFVTTTWFISLADFAYTFLLSEHAVVVFRRDVVKLLELTSSCYEGFCLWIS